MPAIIWLTRAVKVVPPLPSLGLHHDCARIARGGLLRRHAGNLHDEFSGGPHPLRFELTRCCTVAPYCEVGAVVFCLRTRATQADQSILRRLVSVNRKWPRRISGNAAERT